MVCLAALPRARPRLGRAFAPGLVACRAGPSTAHCSSPQHALRLAQARQREQRPLALAPVWLHRQQLLAHSRLARELLLQHLLQRSACQRVPLLTTQVPLGTGAGYAELKQRLEACRKRFENSPSMIVRYCPG